MPTGLFRLFDTPDADGSESLSVIVGVAGGATPGFVLTAAGAVIPRDPVKQFVEERSEAPTVLTIYPGADGASEWYDDDGRSFDYRLGEWTRVLMAWEERDRRLSLRLAPGSRPLPPGKRRFEVRVAGAAKTVPLIFTGREVSIRL